MGIFIFPKLIKKKDVFWPRGSEWQWFCGCIIVYDQNW